MHLQLRCAGTYRKLSTKTRLYKNHIISTLQWTDSTIYISQKTLKKPNFREKTSNHSSW